MDFKIGDIAEWSYIWGNWCYSRWQTVVFNAL